MLMEAIGGELRMDAAGIKNNLDRLEELMSVAELIDVSSIRPCDEAVADLANIRSSRMLMRLAGVDLMEDLGRQVQYSILGRVHKAQLPRGKRLPGSRA
jgi:hypothetical protein